MKKLLLLIAVLVFWGCEEESDATNIVGYTPTDSELDPTVWEGTDNLDDDKLWQFHFYNLEGILMWQFWDICDNRCGGSPYTLNTNVTPNEIDLVVNLGCMEDSYFGETLKGIIEIQTEIVSSVNAPDKTIFSDLTIAISEPGSDSRPSSFSGADAYRVWTLDYVDISDISYQDDFQVVDCDEDYDLSDEAGCGGENDSNIGICAASGCGDGDALFDPTGYRFYNSLETVYDSPSECSGSSETNDVNIFFDHYYEFTADGVNTHDSYHEYEYCIFGSSLYLYYIEEDMFTEYIPNLYEAEIGTTYTMTSDSTFHIQYEAGCNHINSNSFDETEEECNAHYGEWRHCRISYWEGE